METNASRGQYDLLVSSCYLHSTIGYCSCLPLQIKTQKKIKTKTKNIHINIDAHKMTYLKIFIIFTCDGLTYPPVKVWFLFPWNEKWSQWSGYLYACCLVSCQSWSSKPAITKDIPVLRISTIFLEKYTCPYYWCIIFERQYIWQLLVVERATM